MGEFVTLEVEDGIGTIRLGRPPMNAINRQLQAELREAAHEAGTRADVRAVIVYGGPKVFAAGADVKEFAEMSYTDIADYAPELSASVTAVARLPKPTVAAITGYALGGGYELALACDRRIAGDNAKVGQPEVLLGLIPGAGGTQRLARLIGPSRAKDIVYTGRFVDAAEALAIGMVDEVVAPDDVYDAARRWAGQFSHGASRALAAAKAAIDTGLDTDLTSGLAVETNLFAALFATEDRTTGLRSFLENGAGKARFDGR
ncbi:enoyl-CoA hydratase/isomerase family protein [Actinokineospora globicatena]|uniref:enoyl-CoA hydratase/isomerase family protein n=1 Tax=Actinokineospora globicatena TaxID=103729 RepID=UPI0020A3D8E4|nr:enoyl-CoA hydratase/isomerase family protein [Actinokineospora globicatena]MCP2305452.1 short chain enoyl-CoA hydratase [Actinokineospora globicatena]GLW81320.1 enoyl-CoA hydratase [Actinokineospora globicatena]GLW87982.1 enoyl-CoA hydratase [Actinokineospora globicatena]